MKTFTKIIFTLFIGNCFGQDKNVVIPIESSINTSCASSQQVCNQQFFDWNLSDTEGNCQGNSSLYYSFEFNTNGSFDLSLDGNEASYIFYGPLSGDNLEICESVNTYTAEMLTGTLDAQTLSVALSFEEGNYILQIIPTNCIGTGSFAGTTKENLVCNDEVDCINCITSFQPTPGKYIVSAWVKEINAPYTVTTYTHASIEVSFLGSTITYSLTPSGIIIDGWQRIESELIVPSTATGIDIALTVSQGEANFDDIRFFPIDGSMKSYVYDPISLRLMSELDERNYATFYEYDEEGKLIRVKKETEKGIMTIQENRDNIRKGL